MNSDEIKEVFGRHSSDGETMTSTEAYEALCECEKNPLAEQIAPAFKDDKETITVEEFEELYNSIEDPSVEELEKAFQTFDRNGDGTIDIEELKEILKFTSETKGSEPDLNDEAVEAILCNIDTSEDGSLSYKELATYLIERGSLTAHSQE